MKKILFAMIGFMMMVAAKAYAYDDHDFQVWNTDNEEFKLTSHLKLALEQEFRWGNNASEFFYEHFDAALIYVFNKHLSAGGGYRRIYEKKNGDFKVEDDPFLVATLSGEWRGFGLESRNRLEYRSFDYQDDTWRYRNKFTVKLPWKFTALKIQPYVSDEIFVAFGNSLDQFDQNRFSTGLGAELTKNVKAEIYYMLLSAKSSGVWKEANVLGTKIKIAF